MEKPIIVEQQDRVVVVTLNRPAARNALNSEIMHALAAELGPLDRDPGVGCFVLKGSEKAFAAGADIKEMADNLSPICSARIFLPPGIALHLFARRRSPPSRVTRSAAAVSSR